MTSTGRKPRKLGLDNITLKGKIVGSSIGAGLLSAVIAMVAVWGVSTTAAEAEEILGGDVQATYAVRDISRSMADARLAQATASALSASGQDDAALITKRDTHLAQLREQIDVYQRDVAPVGPAAVLANDLEYAAGALQSLYAEMDAGVQTDASGPSTVERASEAGAQAETAIAELAALHQASAQESLAQAKETVGTVILVGIILAVAGAGAAIVGGVLIARSISNRARQVVTVARAMAGGDLTARANLTSRDELGDIGQSLDEAQDKLADTLAQARSAVVAVATGMEQLQVAATQMASGQEESSAQSGVAAASAEQISQSVQTVAAGAEQMGASIREISQNAGKASRVAAQAAEQAKSTNVTVTRLGDSVREVDEVRKVILALTNQTNLLALNATIEAARAGEAGKGFAVVASEVKDLAQETARAAGDIEERITAIQADTASVVDDIGGITQTVLEINDYQMTIASAVEEQTATTSEMSRSVTEVATGSSEIASNISQIAQVAQSDAASVTQITETVTQLAEVADGLNERVSHFQLPDAA